MLQIVQLQDGCYKVVIDYATDGFSVHREYVFRPCESSAPPKSDGEQVRLKFDGE